jgi:LEA14-like dessication related protein
VTAYRKLIAIIFSLGIGLLLSGCVGLPRDFNNLKEPQVSLTGLAVKELNFLAPSLLVRLRVENPNDLNINLDGADVALALNGRPVATGISRSPLTLAKFGASEMNVEVKASTLEVLQQILLLQSNSSVNYDVTGHLNVLNWLGPLGKIPFRFRGDVDRDTLLRGAESLGGMGRLKNAPAR